MAAGQDDRKNAAVGEAVLAEAKSDPTFRAKLGKILDKRVTHRPDRDLLGLDQAQGDHTKTGD
ncbi:hypothetical protein [Amaricoccus tamworthensis]|uniref:hypothetical protein n=1 Tax=Amaricoccus tamworthensis TaxID=57002 RepID=UPI003C7C10FB